MRSRSSLRLFVLVSVVGLIAAACSSDDPTTSASGNGGTPTARPPSRRSSRSRRTAPSTTSTASSSPPSSPTGRSRTTASRSIFQTSFGGSTTQAQNVVNGFPADVVGALAVPRRPADRERRPHHPRPEAGPEGGIVATSAVVFDVRPGNPKHIDNWNDLDQAGRADPDARPRLERRREVEHRGRLRRRDARQGPRLRRERPGRRAEAAHGHLQERHGDGQERQRLAEELPVGQRRRGASPTRTRSSRRRPAGLEDEMVDPAVDRR